MPKAAKVITLRLDELDAEAVARAIAYRKLHPMPDGGGNEAGRAVAEICRGWLDMLGEWEWSGNPKPKQTRDCTEAGGKRRVLARQSKSQLVLGSEGASDGRD